MSASEGGSRSDQLNEEERGEEEEEETSVLEYSYQQRWPAAPGEPVCIVCGRYGQYILDSTDEDVCSLQCKQTRLNYISSCNSSSSSRQEQQLLPSVVDETTPLDIHVTETTPTGTKGEGVAETTPTSVEGEGVTTDDHVQMMSSEQLEQFYKKMELEVRGANIPRPVTHWNQLPLDPKLRSNLVECGYQSLTPVQTLVIPAVLKRRDLLVCSSTGSGKTLSFLLPLVQQLITVPAAAPSVLILAPTRELCIQIEEQAKQLMKGIPDMRSALLIGGVPIAHQLHRLKADVKLLVATPARLQDILTNHSKSVSLSSLHALVLDEVDSLLQMGFEEQIHYIKKHLPAHKQTLLFSATVPAYIERLATQLLNNSLFIAVGMPSTASVNIRHTVLWVEEEAKKKQLFTFLKDKDTFHPPVIIFVNSRKGTLLLADAIDKVCDIPTIALHGEMEQERRAAILNGFVAGKYEAIVATGVLARGLNLERVEQVFIFDAPSSIDEFIHQVGRTSRLGSNGWAITFINNENKGIFTGLVNLLNPLGVELPAQLLHYHQMRLDRKRKHFSDTGGAGADTASSTSSRADYRNKDTLLGLIQSTTSRSKWKRKN